MRRRYILALNLALAAGLYSGAAAAQAQMLAELDLPPQPLSQALHIIADRLNTNILFSPQQVSGLTAPALRGPLTIEQALRRVLAGTQIDYQFMDDRTVSLVPVGEAGKPIADGTQRSEMRLAQSAAVDEQTPALAEGRSSEPESPQEDAATLEEITVTAQKRQERLHEVPISISVLNGADLDQSTAQGVAEALNTVPGVTAQESYIGGGTQVSVRGVSASTPILHGSSPIAYYLDSVPFGLIRTSIAPDANAYDLQRVEVLRGPQGTLYGASALNGVVRVLTNDADLNDFELKARSAISATSGGDANYRADAAINIPIVTDRLAVRAVAGYQDLSGWIERPGAENVNSAEIWSLRLKVNAQPTDALSIGLSTWLSRDDRQAPPQAQEGSFHAIAADEPQSSDYDVYGLTVRYEFSPFTVSSTSSYLRYRNLGILNMGELGLTGTEFVNRYFAEVLSEEINLNSNSAGPWRWAAGGLYRDEDDRTAQNFPGLEAFLGPFDFDDSSKSFAVYGELTRALFDNRLELTAGLRYFEDRVGTRENLLPSGGALPLIAEKSSFEKVTPRAVVKWLPAEDFTLYASYGEGFRSGSQQQPGVIRNAPQIGPLDADSLTSYEVGAKGRVLAGLLSYEGAVYYMDWVDVQSDSSILVNGLPQAALINGESADGIGFDLSVAFHLTDRWDLGVSFSRNDLTYADDVLIASGGGSVVLFPEGSRLSMSPRTSAGAFLDYAFPLGGSGYEARISAAANYSSAQFIKIPNGLGQGDSIFIARSAVTVRARSNWEFSLYADNLTNEDDAIQRAPFFNAPDWTVRPRPRTIGLQVEYRY